MVLAWARIFFYYKERSGHRICCPSWSSFFKKTTWEPNNLFFNKWKPDNFFRPPPPPGYQMGRPLVHKWHRKVHYNVKKCINNIKKYVVTSKSIVRRDYKRYVISLNKLHHNIQKYAISPKMTSKNASKTLKSMLKTYHVIKKDGKYAMT